MSKFLPENDDNDDNADNKFIAIPQVFSRNSQAKNLPHTQTFNSLPNDKILDMTKLKAFADDKINETLKLKFALGQVENILGKGVNAGYQHFLLFS